MGVPIGKRDITRVAKILSDESLTTAEEAAEAALRAAFEIYESRAVWAVVGQLKWADAARVPADRADKICLGLFATESSARAAGRMLAFNTKTNETFRWWMLPVWHGTPDKYYVARRDAKQEAAAKPSPGAPGMDPGAPPSDFGQTVESEPEEAV